MFLFEKKNEKNNYKKLSFYKILFKQKGLGADLDFPGSCPNTKRIGGHRKVKIIFYTSGPKFNSYHPHRFNVNFLNNVDEIFYFKDKHYFYMFFFKRIYI